MTTPAMQFYSLHPPARWQAGTTGAAQTPFYFNCADCGAKEPPIAGIISTDGTFKGIGVLGGTDGPNGNGVGFVRPAMFCEPCFQKRLDAPRS